MNGAKTLRNRNNNSKTKKNRKTYLILQYDSRSIKKEFRTLININKKYCSLYGYDYILDTKKYNLPPYWIKVMLVDKLLKTNKYKGILWLDTDAVINDFSISLDSICCPNKSIYYAYEFFERHDPIKKDFTGLYRFNAGVWFVLNNKMGKEIMNAWLSLYDPQKWSFINKKWECIDCKWAGLEYEQGSFEKYIIPKYKKYCKQEKNSFFQSTSVKNVDTNEPKFIYHFYGKFIKPNELNNYLNTKQLTIKTARE